MKSINVFLVSPQNSGGSCEECLAEVLLMSTHNIRFWGEIRKKANLATHLV